MHKEIEGATLCFTKGQLIQAIFSCHLLHSNVVLQVEIVCCMYHILAQQADIASIFFNTKICYVHANK